MTLTFRYRKQFGKERYYPSGPAAQAVVDLTGRLCLKRTEVERLAYAGFTVDVIMPEREVAK